MHKPFLIGNKIYLREIEPADLNENYQQWFNDEEVCQFNSHHRFPNYKQDMDNYYNTIIKSKNNLILAIILKKTDKHIGNISLQSIDFINRSAEFAIIIGDKSSWGKGVGGEAVDLVINHGFGQLNLNRIYCGTSRENIGMQRLAEKFGFKKEGIFRQAFFKNDQYHDTIIYGLTRDRYEREKKNFSNKQ